MSAADQPSPSPVSNTDPFHDNKEWMEDDLLGDSEVPLLAGKHTAGPEVSTGRRERISRRSHTREGGRLVLAIDYGTTFTGVASSSAPTDHADLDRIEVLQQWTTNMDNESQVPSVISYSTPTPEVAQWGSDFTQNAVTVSRTKLELEPQAALEELDMLLQVLKGTGFLTFKAIRDAENAPTYTSRTPEEIISDYLRKIFECANKELNLQELHAAGIPLDIVLTVPVGWSDKAYGSIFKAARGAGFNRTELPTLQDVVMLTEAEAAAYFTARDISRRKDIEFLKVNDCFILCDAGGGTVDLVSFQAKRTEPQLELERVTKPTGGRYGSSLIDNDFKAWLRKIIGESRYERIDPENAYTARISPHTAETSAMRKVMRRFNIAKADFKGTGKANITLDLSKSLGALNIKGRMEDGLLSMSCNEMKKLMDPYVNGTIGLIQDQIAKVNTGQKRRVRDLILVGGFGGSHYLQSMLQQTPTIRNNNIHIRRPDIAMTAVVQGGVMYGIEKNNFSHATYMRAITKSYGILYRKPTGDTFEWLIRKGDLALSNKAITKTSEPFFIDARALVNGKRKLEVFTYCERDANDDDVPTVWETGVHEVVSAGAATCDFTKFLGPDLHPYPGSLMPGYADWSPPKTKVGPLKWQFKISSEELHAEVLHGHIPVGFCNIKMETDWHTRHNHTRM